MAALMKEMSSLGIRDRFKKMQELQSGGLFNPGSKMAKPKGGTGKRRRPTSGPSCASSARRKPARDGAVTETATVDHPREKCGPPWAWLRYETKQIFVASNSSKSNPSIQRRSKPRRSQWQ